jgi:hypothetical protein
LKKKEMKKLKANAPPSSFPEYQEFKRRVWVSVGVLIDKGRVD